MLLHLLRYAQKCQQLTFLSMINYATAVLSMRKLMNQGMVTVLLEMFTNIILTAAALFISIANMVCKHHFTSKIAFPIKASLS